MAKAAAEPSPGEGLNLHQRINVVQSRIDYIQKEKKAGMRYSIVSHDAVTALVRPHFVEMGIVFYPIFINTHQAGNRTEMVMTVRFVNKDDPSDIIDVMTAGHGIDEQDKGPGKAISYCVKYALLKALALESGDDPDDNQDAVYENLSDPHILAMKEFGLAVDGAQSAGDLATIMSEFKLRMTAAKLAYPVKAAAAASAYSARLHALKATSKGASE